jgi:flagellar biosynthetic protein FlhB
MAEHNENPTEKPTEKRLREAHERGQFARAPEIQVAAGLLASYFVVLVVAKSQSEQIASFAAMLFGHLEKFELKPESVIDWARLGFAMVGGLCLPMMGACALSSLLVGGVQSGFVLTPKVLELKPEKLNPVTGFQRVFSKAGLVRLLVDAVKFAVVALLIYGGVQQILSDPIFYTPVPLTRLGGFIHDTTLSLLARLSLALGVLALAHYLYQRLKTEKDLMMSKQELKEEMKEANGDPLVRMARRAMARRLMQKQMLSAVPTADVIVTNPTHFAVALKYERGKDAAPVVLAKGENYFARRIKAIGRAHEVPMVENKPVARALFKYGRVGECIPGPLYHAVAEILGYVYRTHRYYFHQLKSRRLTG